MTKDVEHRVKGLGCTWDSLKARCEAKWVMPLVVRVDMEILSEEGKSDLIPRG